MLQRSTRLSFGGAAQVIEGKTTDKNKDNEDSNNPFLVSPLRVNNSSGNLFPLHKSPDKSPRAKRASLSRRSTGESTLQTGISVSKGTKFFKSPKLVSKVTVDDAEDADSPSSSLPIASSDGEASENESGKKAQAKEHWRGLPPSSPPPPSSPALGPVDVLPSLPQEQCESGTAASSDDSSDGLLAHFPGFTPRTGFSLPPFSSSEFSFGTFGGTSNSEVFSDDPGMSFDALSDMLGLTSEPASEFEAIDFSGVPFITDGTNTGGQPVTPGLDLAEFWESFKPLMLEAHQRSPQRTKDGVVPIPSISNTATGDPPIELDAAGTAKLAEDLQALFGGCLV